MITNQSLSNCHNFSNTSILIYFCVEVAESSDFVLCFLLIILKEIFGMCGWMWRGKTGTSLYVELKPVLFWLFLLKRKVI